MGLSKVICLVYVDDCLFFPKEQPDIDQKIAQIRETGMDLNIQDNIARFLGVLLKYNEEGTVTLLQTRLIGHIISAMQLEDSNHKWNLHAFVFSQQTQDLTLHMHVTSQCACYMHKPTEKQRLYLKHIGH